MSSKKRYTWLFLVALLIAAFLLYREFGKDIPDPEKENLVDVSFGMLPYGDHTNAYIGIANGWFKEVGINLDYEVIKVEAVVPSLSNRSLDVVSTAPGLLLAAYENAPDNYMFVFGDIFQGYALMGQPDRGVQSYSDFLSKGLSSEEAIKSTIRQLIGKDFAYPSESAIKPFIDLLLEKGEIDKSQFESKIVDDPIAVNLMRQGAVDFQVGGAPSRITLQKEGFVPLISAIDLAKSASPSPDSEELATIFPDGWAVNKEFYENEYPTVLRLASVSYRISEYIQENPDGALQIHMPFLTSVTGEEFTVEDGRIIYEHLDPFYSFEAQRPWYEDSQNPLYYKNLIGSLINSFVRNGMYESVQPTVEDVIFADDVYRELDNYRKRTNSILDKLDESNLDQEQQEKLKKVKHLLLIHNYFDAYEHASKINK